MNRHVLISLVVGVIFVISGVVAWNNHDPVLAAVSGLAAVLFAGRALLILKRPSDDA